MLKSINEWVKSLFKSYQTPQTYGSALEAYIVSHNPTSSCDIDHYTRQFDRLQAKRSTAGWAL